MSIPGTRDFHHGLLGARHNALRVQLCVVHLTEKPSVHLLVRGIDPAIGRLVIVLKCNE